ncbi:hypothetical protein [Oceanobacillus locisalsi]|uniref:Spore coat protein n=1 Tax=Oceanobacillus locisalsi TaxID=546107 RepID=A0ABW3NET7_9BACI
MHEMRQFPEEPMNPYGGMDSRLFFGGPGFWGPGFYGPGFYGPGVFGPGYGPPIYGNPVFQYGIPFLGGVITGMAIDQFPRYEQPYGHPALHWQGNQSV